MKQLLQTISKSEWRFVWVISCVLVALTSLPYIVGWLAAPPGFVYTGLHALSPGDIPVYYSYIQQAASGELFVKNLFTAESQQLGTFNVWWWLVSLPVRFLGLSAPLAFQLSRLAMIPVFVAVAYVFLSYFFQSALLRKLSLFFILFSSGLGAYAVGGMQNISSPNDLEPYAWPIDLWLVEATTFNGLLQTSHFIASLSLTLGMFLCLLLGFRTKQWRYSLVAGGLGLFYFNFHPYYLPSVFGTLGLYWLAETFRHRRVLWHQGFQLVIAAALSLPSALYHLWLIQQEPVIGLRAAQNVTLIAPLPYVLVGYGLLLVGGLIGAGVWWRQRSRYPELSLLVIWLAVSVGLIYSPFPFHSRYTQGIQFGLAIFTVLGLLAIKDQLQRRLSPRRYDFWVKNPTLLGWLFVLGFMPSILFNLTRDFYLFTVQPEEAREKLYLSEDLVSAIAWLGTQPKTSVTLASDIMSKFIPGQIGQAVFVGHGHETVHAKTKRAFLEIFYASNENDRFKRRGLSKHGIDFVAHGSLEQKLGSFDPSQTDYLTLVFESGEVQVYRVDL
ncbi:MAG TPA: hypothetical protein VGA08_01210 [Candidatus Saccharimonadales bacterium]